MRPINIFLESYNTLDIKECTINKTVNEHFTASVTGYIYGEDDEKRLYSLLNSPFVIKVITDEQEEISLFRGQIRDMYLSTEGGLRKLKILAVSNTIELDKEKHTRTFQGVGQTYRQIMDRIKSHHENTAVIYAKGKGITTNGLVVQYMETDWEFLKRLSAQMNTVLVADCTNDHTCYYVGNPEKKGKTQLDFSKYGIRWYRDCVKGQAVEYLVNSREILKLCESIMIEGSQYYVYSIIGSMCKEEMVFEYILRPLSGFQVQPYSHNAIAGISIIGTVINVEDTSVQVSLSCEVDESYGNPIWFPFSSVYASPDGTGWYCMPEIGDRIRLYIPDEKEDHAYVISAFYVDDEQNLRNNPDEKSIRTKYNKEIRLTPEKILITNHKGMSMTLDDRNGITIKSNKNINILSEEGIEVKGEEVVMEGKQGVYFMEGPNLLMVRDGIKEQAVNIEHR
ncbi:phage baseplate assembly protein V [Lacrimispora sp. AGF001]|uniref:phage baseplate assembly protein V n=1 Tax=Lacrimispora sp. AGF001 TaxID=3401631 RepID=UPI003B431693